MAEAELEGFEGLSDREGWRSASCRRAAERLAEIRGDKVRRAYLGGSLVSSCSGIPLRRITHLRGARKSEVGRIPIQFGESLARKLAPAIIRTTLGLRFASEKAAVMAGVHKQVWLPVSTHQIHSAQPSHILKK